MTDTTPNSPDAPIESWRKVQTNILWPAPVDERLNELVAELEEVSAGDFSRSRLLAVLVALAPSEGSDLEGMVKKYRQLTAREIGFQAPEQLEQNVRMPGRRARRS